MSARFPACARARDCALTFNFRGHDAYIQMHTYHICTWLCGGRTVFHDAQLDWHGCTGEVRGTDTSMEAVGVRVVRVGKAGDGAVCQATCLVQSSGIWSIHVAKLRGSAAEFFGRF